MGARERHCNNCNPDPVERVGVFSNVLVVWGWKGEGGLESVSTGGTGLVERVGVFSNVLLVMERCWRDCSHCQHWSCGYGGRIQ